MAGVRHFDTPPELIVRSYLHRQGLRFRVHRQDLPGNPDIVLPKYQSVVFVHGCFWHQHSRCRRSKTPSSNVDYWLPKLRQNVRRDRENRRKLKELGWHVHIIWECQVKDTNRLKRLSDAIQTH